MPTYTALMHMNRAVKMINVTGPMPLSCTTPFNKSATEDNEAPTRV